MSKLGDAFKRHPEGYEEVDHLEGFDKLEREVDQLEDKQEDADREAAAAKDSSDNA